MRTLPALPCLLALLGAAFRPALSARAAGAEGAAGAALATESPVGAGEAAAELLRAHPGRGWEMLARPWEYRPGGQGGGWPAEFAPEHASASAAGQPGPFRTFAVWEQGRAPAGQPAQRPAGVPSAEPSGTTSWAPALDLLASPRAAACLGGSASGSSPAPAATLSAAEDNEAVALDFLAGVRCLRSGYRRAELSHRDARACGLAAPGDVPGLLHSARHRGLAAEACLRSDGAELRGDAILAGPGGAGRGPGGPPCPTRCDDGSRLSRRRFPGPARLENDYASVLRHLEKGEPALVRLEAREDLRFYASGPYRPLWGGELGELWFLLLGYGPAGPGRAAWRLRGPPAVGEGGWVDLEDAGLARALAGAAGEVGAGAAGPTPFSQVLVLSEA